MYEYLKEQLSLLNGMPLYRVKHKLGKALRLSFGDIKCKCVIFVSCFYRFILNNELYLSLHDSMDPDSFRTFYKKIAYARYLNDFSFKEFPYNYATDIEEKIEKRLE